MPALFGLRWPFGAEPPLNCFILKENTWMVTGTVSEQHFGVVGYGDIGRECAKLARAFGMTIHATSRNPEALLQKDSLVSYAYGFDQIGDLMAACDYVCMVRMSCCTDCVRVGSGLYPLSLRFRVRLAQVTPLVPATVKLVGAAEFNRMKPTGVFMNLGRGQCIDQDALVKVLQDKKIKGAALDVTDPEPLPDGHVMYSMGPELLLSAHSADVTANMTEMALKQCLRSMHTYAEHGFGGLDNIVDKKKGY